MKLGTGIPAAIAVSFFVAGPVLAQAPDAPYGTAKFAPHADIDSIKQLKVVWDFNFIDPKAIGIGFGNLNSLLRTATEFGPRESDPIKVVVVSHGPEIVVFDRRNYGKYKDLVDRAAALANQGVKFEVCAERRRYTGSHARRLARQGEHELWRSLHRLTYIE